MDWLFDNPILLLILISWLVSAMGGVMQKAARKAEEQQRRARRPPAGGGAPRPSEPAAPAAPTARQGPTADEIAREIRRALGVERPAPERRPAEGAGHGPPPVRRPETAGPRPQVVVVPDRPVHRGRLSEELAQREREARERELAERRRRESRRDEIGGNIRHRELRVARSSGARVTRAGGRESRKRRLFDLSHPAAAFVTMEVLGPPVALRSEAPGRLP